jgi:hypothetical protein
LTDLRVLLARAFRFTTTTPTTRGRYTPEAVKRYLRRQVEPTDSDAVAIRRALECLPLLVHDPQVERRFQGFQRYAEFLPKIIFLYLRGDDPKQIARCLHFLATDYGIEAVVDITAEIVAERLNTGAFSPSPAVG